MWSFSPAAGFVMLLPLAFQEGNSMNSKVTPILAVLLLSGTFSVPAFAQKKSSAPKEPAKPSYEMPQPEREALDSQAYASIREEAILRSHVMEYASALTDGIGPR